MEQKDGLTVITPETLHLYAYTGVREKVGKTRSEVQLKAGMPADSGIPTNFSFEYEKVPLETILANGEKPVVISTRQKFDNSGNGEKIPRSFRVTYGVRGGKVITPLDSALEKAEKGADKAEFTPEELKALKTHAKLLASLDLTEEAI